MSSSINLKYEKTSFLSKSNSTFIEEMYVRFIRKDPNLPDSWKRYFETLDDDIPSVIKEIEGPTWNPNKKKLDFKIYPKSETAAYTENKDSETSKQESIKAIALIRAYRIRGHLIANLDPLKMMERKYLHELHPKDHGFKKNDYDKKIFLGSYMDTGLSLIHI